MYKRYAGTTPGGTYKRFMYSPVIKLNTPGYLKLKAASALRKAQIASAKARRASAAMQRQSLARRKNLMSKFKRFK